MKKQLFFSFLVLTCLIQAQNKYSKETEAKIAAVENSLAGRVKITTEPEYNILERMKFYNVKGLSIAVVDDYKIAWAKGYGWADEAEKRPVTTETLFEPGSISKSLNAVGILKLVQDKKLDLHTDINTYLSSWKFPYDTVSHGKKITLAHLLSHSAGLTVHGFPGYDRTEKIPTTQQVLDGQSPANTPAVRSEFEPGLKFKYSGGGTTISQLIVCDVTKEAYEDYMYTNVLKPMGMEHSFYNQPPQKEKVALCASAYYPDGNPVPHQFHVYPEKGAAGLWMTPSDLCNYIIETQLAYEGKSSKVLGQEMTKLRLTPYNDESAALGVFIEKRNDTYYFQHGAGNEGFCGIYYGSLKGGKGLAIFMNSSNPTLLQEVVNSVATVYQWENFYKPVYKDAVKIKEKLMEDYPGIYLFEGKWAAIDKKDDKCFFFSDGINSQMYFTAPDKFFNKEFATEKSFVRDDKGKVTGYLRTLNGKDLPSALRITSADTLHMDMEVLNDIAWHLMEHNDFPSAFTYLNRALELNPGNLMLLGNLAHCYLFTNKYDKAMEIYRAHLKETLDGAFTWEKMIQNDFLFFKRQGFDRVLMEKVFKDLKLNSPKDF